MIKLVGNPWEQTMFNISITIFEICLNVEDVTKMSDVFMSKDVTKYDIYI